MKPEEKIEAKKRITNEFNVRILSLQEVIKTRQQIHDSEIAGIQNEIDLLELQRDALKKYGVD